MNRRVRRVVETLSPTTTEHCHYPSSSSPVSHQLPRYSDWLCTRPPCSGENTCYSWAVTLTYVASVTSSLRLELFSPVFNPLSLSTLQMYVLLYTSLRALIGRAPPENDHVIVRWFPSLLLGSESSPGYPFSALGRRGTAALTLLWKWVCQLRFNSA